MFLKTNLSQFFIVKCLKKSFLTRDRLKMSYLPIRDLRNFNLLEKKGFRSGMSAKSFSGQGDRELVRFFKKPSIEFFSVAEKG